MIILAFLIGMIFSAIVGFIIGAYSMDSAWRDKLTKNGFRVRKLDASIEILKIEP
jgi:membrane protein DedA with SNARE-associated domain